MTNALTWLLAAAAGALLGVVFYGGLWWTVRRGLASRQPALWFVGSLLARTGITLLGFYVVGGHRVDRLLLCLAGFVLAGVGATRVTRALDAGAAGPAREAGHAP